MYMNSIATVAMEYIASRGSTVHYGLGTQQQGSVSSEQADSKLRHESSKAVCTVNAGETELPWTVLKPTTGFLGMCSANT